MRNITIEGTHDYAIFFDDQKIDKYVKGFSVDLGVNGRIGHASIEVLFSEELLRIDYLTDVKIFIKNIFSGKYQQVFDGHLRSRQISMHGSDKTIVFGAKDNLAWLPKIPVPLLFGVDQLLDGITTFRWLAKGINYEKVSSVLTTAGLNLSDKNLREIVDFIFSKIDESTLAKSDGSLESNSIYNHINLKGKVKVLSDIDKTLRQEKIIDVFFQGAVVENTYVLLNGIISQLGYEFYQDIDGIIKIKEPYWHEGIALHHVIDPNIVMSFDENVDWDSMCTRVFVVGGVDTSLFPNTDPRILSYFTPAGVFIGSSPKDGVDNDGFSSSPSEGTFIDKRGIIIENVTPDSPSYVPEKPQISAHANRRLIAQVAEMQAGKPYVWGADGPNSFDCSGLVYYSYTQAGYKLHRKTAQDYYVQSIKIKPSELQVGDLGFTKDIKTGRMDHVGIYCGTKVIGGQLKHLWVDAATYHNKVKVNRVVVREESTARSFWTDFGTLVPVIQAGFRGTTIAVPTGKYHQDLSSLSSLERKYGISVLETRQPLIKFWLGEDMDGEGAYKELAKYSEYLYHINNATSVSASVSLIASPWIRPGMNIWLDPLGINRVYYVNAIRHYGGPQGVFTSLGLTYGRTESEFKHNYKSKGGNGNSIDSNSFTKDRNTITKDYTTTNGGFDYITNSNTEAVKSALKNDLSGFKDKGGSFLAENSYLRKYYGRPFVRRNTWGLNRWDSEFNLAEIQLMLRAELGQLTAEDNNLIRTEEVSKFVTDVVIPHAIKAPKTSVITARKNKLASIMEEADKEISVRYTRG